jgi:hypothetical protein
MTEHSLCGFRVSLLLEFSHRSFVCFVRTSFTLASVNPRKDFGNAKDLKVHWMFLLVGNG